MNNLSDLISFYVDLDWVGNRSYQPLGISDRDHRRRSIGTAAGEGGGAAVDNTLLIFLMANKNHQGS